MLSTINRMVDYKIFSFLYRFVCVCQYDFCSCVWIYAILVNHGILESRIPIWQFFDFQIVYLTLRSMGAGQGTCNVKILSRPAVLAFVNGRGYNLSL